MIPESLFITPYYQDPVQHDRDAVPLKEAAHLAYDSPLAAPDILLAYALTCREAVNFEARLTLVYVGQLFLEAYLRLDPWKWNSGVFGPWVDTVFRPCAEEMAGYRNNVGSWGLLGLILADLVTGKNPRRHEDQLAWHMADTWDYDGTMFREVRRTNSGIWYSYFSLAPLLRSCQLLESVLIWNLITPLNWLWQYCQDPYSWPYCLPKGFMGWLWKKLFPCADHLELPRRESWPGNLYLAAGHQFDNPLWRDYATRPLRGVHIYRESYFERR